MLSLSNGISGMEYVIAWFIATTAAMEAMKKELGLMEGARIHVVQNCGSGVIIRHRGRRFALSGDVASRIKISES